jgi:hypothetical protein
MRTLMCTEYLIVHVLYLHIVIYIVRVCAKYEEALLDVKKTGLGKSFKQCPLDRRSWRPTFFTLGSSIRMALRRLSPHPALIHSGHAKLPYAFGGTHPNSQSGEERRLLPGWVDTSYIRRRVPGLGRRTPVRSVPYLQK